MSKTQLGNNDFWSPSGRFIGSRKKETASLYQIVLLGITIVIGGQLFSWNSGIRGGFYTFLFATLFIASGYVCLCLCLAEMTSILPFAGGSYGFGRVTVGPYLGYLIGCCESMESIIYVPSTLIIFGQLLTTLFATSSSLEPLWWLLFYLSANVILVAGGSVFWNFNTLIGFVSLILIVLYCVATPAFADFDSYVTNLNPQLEPSAANSNSPVQFLQYVHLAAWFFVGVEGLPLSCLEAKNAKLTVPRALLITVGVLLVTALGILFCSASLSPGVVALASETLPLSAGYSRAFSISSRAASLLALPGIYATAFGFMFLFGRQMSSMAKSGLFPSCMSLSFGPSKAPYVSLLTGSTVGYVVLIVLYFSFRELLDRLFNICILSSFFVYVYSFASFIIFRRKFSRLERNFRNPLGIASAVYGMFVFVVGFIGVSAFQNDNQEAIIIFIGMLILFSIYYYFVAMKRQFFSEEEQSIMFVTYVIAGNALKKAKKKRSDESIRVSVRSSISQLSSGSSSQDKHTPVAGVLAAQRSYRRTAVSPAPEPAETQNLNELMPGDLQIEYSDVVQFIPLMGLTQSPHPDGVKRGESNSTATTASTASVLVSNRSRGDDDLKVIEEGEEEEYGFDSEKR